MKLAIDDLPRVSASRMRALGEITAERKVTAVRFDDVEFTVGVALVRFPNGGNWSLFIAPCCGHKVRTLRLLDGDPVCCRCCRARGLRSRVELIRTEERAAWHALNRIERLNSATPARLHPRPGRMLDRRANIENALRRSLIVARQHALDEHDERLKRWR
jgi:hypothetical protein